MTLKSFLLPVVAAFLVTVAAACGTTTDTPDAGTTPDAGSPVNTPDAGPHDAGTPDAGTQVTAKTVDVSVAPNTTSFEPASVTIKVGDTVRWTWAHGGHNVIGGASCTSDDSFCSPSDASCASAPTSDSGTIYSHTFTAAGTFPYFCNPHCHSGMTGTVIVQ